MNPWRSALALGLAGCGALAEGVLTVDDPRELTCDEGTVEVLVPERASERRWSEGTEVRSCVGADGRAHGSHAELHPSGAIAVVGSWAEGERHGTWVRWSPEGAYAGRTDFVGGERHGVEHLISDDGQVLELRFEHGVAMDMRALPRATPMPEWVEGRRVEGTRHLAEEAVAPPSGADP